MIQELPITPRVLIVEDSAEQARAMELSLLSASKESSDLFQVQPFRIDKAASEHGALKYLIKPYPSYDICLLDLSLPKNDGDGKEEPRAGYNILEHIVKTGAVKKVIIVSVFSEYKYVIEAFRSGAFDFISKPYEPDALPVQVYNCLQRSLNEESNSILNKRIRELVPYAEKGFARNFSATLSPLFTSVGRVAKGIKSYAHEHYGLDSQIDWENDLIVQLRSLEESTGEARQNLERLQSLLPEDDEKPQPVDIDELLIRINRELLPCLSVKKTRLSLQLPQAEQLSVLTFQDDVRAVLTEIMAGGLSELTDYGDPHNIQVKLERKGKEGIVRFEDDLKPISRENAGAINNGYRIISDPQFKRVWGLSVAQHVAMSSGGYLKVEPKERGNVITFNVSLKNHA